MDADLQNALESGASRNICIRFPDSNRKDITNGIYPDSAYLNRTLCSSQDLNFGECNASQFEIQVYGITTNIDGVEVLYNMSDVSGEKIQVYVNVDGLEDSITIFTGYVESAKLQTGGRYRKIVAYDELYYHASDDVTDWYNNVFPTTTKSNYKGAWSISQKYEYDNVVKYAGEYYQYLCDSDSKFLDDNEESHNVRDYLVGKRPNEIVEDSTLSTYVQKLEDYDEKDYGYISIYDFRKSLFDKIGIETEEVELINDSINITHTSVNTLTFNDCITAVCEANACFGHINESGIFTYITDIGKTSIDYSQNYRGDSTEYEEFTSEIDAVVLYDSFGNLIAQEQPEESKNPWCIQNNFIVYSMNSSDMSKVATALYNKVVTSMQISYTPCTLTAGLSLIGVGLGEKITFKVSQVSDDRVISKTLSTYVLQDTLSGTQLVKQVITAYGNNTRENTVNVSDAIEQVSSQMSDIKSDMDYLMTVSSANIKKISGELANYKVIIAEYIKATNATITNLDATNITSGFLDSERIKVESITADKLDISDLSALKANIANWIISAYQIYLDLTELDMGYAGLNADGFIGEQDPEAIEKEAVFFVGAKSMDGGVTASSCNFAVTPDGRIYSKKLNISGGVDFGSYTLIDDDGTRNFAMLDDFEDSGWITPTLSDGATHYSGTPVRYRKKDGVIYVAGEVALSNATSSSYALFTLPSGYRPKNRVRCVNTASGKRISRWYINTAGNVTLEWIMNIADGSYATGEISWVSINVSFPI